MFILGIIFIVMVIPIGESITSLILTFIEALKSELGAWIAKNNQKLERDSAQPQRLIGFAISEEEEEVENDDL